jgi:ABC-type multidrug transport system fused ATPase/permease subunit
MSALRLRATAIARLVRGRGFAWAGLGLGSALLQAVMETLLAVVLILFLFSLGFVDRTRVPRWMPADWAHAGVGMVLAVLLSVGLLRALFQLLSAMSFHALLELVRARLHMVQGYRMLLADARAPFSPSDVTLMMGEYFTKASDYVYQSAQALAGLALGFSILAGMLWLAWKETVLGLACLAAFGVVIWRLNHAIGEIAANIPKQRGVMERALARVCRNRLLIYAMRLEGQEHRHFLRAVVAYFHFSRHTFFLRDVTGVLPPLFGIASLVAVVGASLAFFRTPPVELVAFVYLFVSFSRSIGSITDQTSARRQFRSQFDEVALQLDALGPDAVAEAFGGDHALGFRRRPGDRAAARATPRPASPSPPAPPAIELRGVRFAWAPAAPPVFSGLDLRIPAGSRFGVTGLNGTGKSTLLGLVLGVLSPDSGEVLVDGVPASEYVRTRGPVGYVGTDNLLISGSVRDNLLYGLEGQASSAEIGEALVAVGLDAWVRALPDGLEHSISENEEGLSSGQRQRLALARAFLRRPALLILDEPSASLDAAGEAELAGTLGALSGRCTMVIVSHKPGILAGADHVHRLPEPAHG